MSPDDPPRREGAAVVFVFLAIMFLFYSDDLLQGAEAYISPLERKRIVMFEKIGYLYR